MKGLPSSTLKTVVLHGVTKSFMLKPWLIQRGKLGDVVAKTESLDFKEPARDGRSWFSDTASCVVTVRSFTKSDASGKILNRPVASMVLERIGEST